MPSSFAAITSKWYVPGGRLVELDNCRVDAWLHCESEPDTRERNDTFLAAVSARETLEWGTEAAPWVAADRGRACGGGTAQSSRLPGKPFFPDHKANLFPPNSASPRSDAIQTLPSLPAEIEWSMPPGRLSASVNVRNPAPS